jgi:hypothetical protein
MKPLSLALLVATTLACGSRQPGTEGGRCYGNGTCNVGLVCASDLCVSMTGKEGGLFDSRTCASMNLTGAGKVVVPNSAAFDLGTSLSMMIWVRTSAASDARYLFDNGISGNYCPAFGAGVDSTGHLLVTSRGGQGPLKCDPNMTATSGRVVPTQRWVHLAAVYDTSAVRFYIDAVGEPPLTVASVDAYPPIHDLWIGGEDGPHKGLVGSLHSARLWSRALTDAEVQQAMAGGAVDKSGLVGSWPLNEGTGTVAHDTSGNGHDGTIQGATWQPGCPP